VGIDEGMIVGHQRSNLFHLMGIDGLDKIHCCLDAHRAWFYQSIYEHGGEIASVFQVVLMHLQFARLWASAIHFKFLYLKPKALVEPV
jgi:hypothetical protein